MVFWCLCCLSDEPLITWFSLAYTDYLMQLTAGDSWFCLYKQPSSVLRLCGVLIMDFDPTLVKCWLYPYLLTAASSFFQSLPHSKHLIYIRSLKDHLAIIARSFLGFCHKYLLISCHNIPIKFSGNDNHSVVTKQSQVSFYFCRHDMPRKRKTTQPSKTGCVTGTSAASGHVL